MVKLLLLHTNTNLPCPYSLGFRVQGTNGLWKGEGGGDWQDGGEKIYVEGKSKPHVWDNAEAMQQKIKNKFRWMHMMLRLGVPSQHCRRCQ